MSTTPSTTQSNDRADSLRTTDLAPIRWRQLKDSSDAELGQTMRDRLTGLEGVASSRIEYLTGCTQFALAQPGVTADGNTKEWRYFDWQRLEVAENIENPWVEVRKSESTRRADGPGEAPRGQY